MHGSIFVELEKFVTKNHSADTWRQLKESAGLADKIYDPLKAYPDADAMAIVGAASKATGAEANDILEAFGEFIVPDLLQMFWGVVDPGWKTLELIENTEETIHKVVRLDNPGAEPPRLAVTRVAEDELRIMYASPRHLCALARGIAKGVAGHYQERIEITETACMLKGADACEIKVRRVPA